MNKIEIDTFIEKTGEFGDIWTFEQAKDAYGDKTLDEALADRMSSYEYMSNIIHNVIDK